jgi:hypothetical protein
VIVLVAPETPWVIATLDGDADNTKLGAGLTVRLKVAVFVRLPEIPVMVTVAVPVVEAALAVKVSELLLAVLVGLKTAVTPAGNPDADKETLALNPF